MHRCSLFAIVFAVAVVAIGCSARTVSTSTAPAPSATQVLPDRPPPVQAISPSASAAPVPPPAPPAPIRPPTVEWARRFGAYGDDHGQRVAVMSDGTIVLAGLFEFQIELDKAKLSGESNVQGNPGAFVALLAPDGQVRSVTNLHAQEVDYITDIAIGPDDSIAFAGNVRAINAGCGKVRSAHWDDILVGSFDKQGKCVFSRAYGSKGNDSGDAVAVDRAGNIIVGGTAQKGTKVGGGIVSTRGEATPFAASFTKSGEHRWSLDIEQKPYSHVKAIAVDASGNAFFGGYARPSDPNWNADRAIPDPDASLIAISADGKLSWKTTFVGPKLDAINGLVVDPRTGEIIVVGSFSEFIDIGDVHLESAGGGDGFVARLDPKGKVLWARRFGGVSHQDLRQVALDAAGNLYATGYSDNASFVYGDTELRTVGGSDIVVISMYPDGSPRWGQVFGGPRHDSVSGLAVEASGRILITGGFSDRADFGGTKLKSEGGGDIFVVALRPSGP